MLVAAKEVSQIKPLATKLEGAEFSNWVRQNKPAEDVFKLFRLDQEADDILKNTALKSWIGYVEALSEDPYKLLLVKMKNRYSDLELAGMFEGARQHFGTVIVGEGMKTALLNLWKGEKKLSEDAVFKLLKLDEDGDKLFQNPLVNTYASYVKKLDSSGSDEPIFLALRKRFGEEGLAQMLLTKSGKPVRLAESLENVQIKIWKAEEKTADDIFKLLNLQKHNEKLLESAEFNSWLSYVARMEKGDPDEVVASVLRTHYDGKTLASMIDAAKQNPTTKSVANRLQEELSLSEGNSVEDIFNLLKLDEAGDDIFKIPALATWVSYVMKVNTRDKNADEFLAVAVLANKIGEVDELELAMRISAAKVFRNSDKTLIDLQNLQFKQWLKNGRTPASLSRWITKGDFDTRSTGVALDYHDFFQANSRGH